MKLKRAREIAARIRIDRRLHDKATDDPPTQSGSAIILLDDRITELETERLHLRTLIRSEQIKPPFDIEDDVTTELAVALADMEKQRDELVEACKELIIESVNNITNEGHDGIEANKTDIDLIEKVTGEIWQEI